MNTSSAIRTALVLGLGLTLATAASPAQAADFTVTFPAGVACPLFDLTVSGTGGNAEARVTQDHAGRPVRVISAGTGSALVFTNESTQETLSLPSNGAVTRTTLGANGISTVSVLGHTVIILYPTDQPPGPTTTLYTGNVTYTTTADQTFTLLRSSGRTLDICAALS